MSTVRLLAALKPMLKAPLTNAASLISPLILSRYQTPLLVLMYHRILPKSDPRFAKEEPGMIVTPATFQNHLQTLKQFLTPMTLSDWIERRQQGKTLPARACAITFDDGWRDNFEFALPILRKEQIPATIFAVSDMIGTFEQFWPNRLGCLLNDPATDFSHPTFQWLSKLQSFPESSPIGRESAAHIIDECKNFDDGEMENRLALMEQSQSLPEPEAALMDWDQLRTAQRSGLIEVGSHTCRHLRLLAGLTDGKLRQEVVQSKQRLQDELGTDIKLFCYPNGDASQAATQLVSEHYMAAVTTRRGINTPATAAHELLRIGIHEDISDSRTKFRARLSGLL